MENTKGRPRLFCDSLKFLVPKKWDKDLAINNQGDVYRDSDGEPLTIGKVPRFKEYRGKGIIPQLATTYNEYSFTSRAEGAGFCKPKLNLGFTTAESENLPEAVVICPQTFIASRSIGGRPARFAELGEPPSTGASIQKVQTQSLTLLHESVHVIKTPKGSTLDDKLTEICSLSFSPTRTRRL